MFVFVLLLVMAVAVVAVEEEEEVVEEEEEEVVVVVVAAMAVWVALWSASAHFNKAKHLYQDQIEPTGRWSRRNCSTRPMLFVQQPESKTAAIKQSASAVSYDTATAATTMGPDGDENGDDGDCCGTCCCCTPARRVA